MNIKITQVLQQLVNNILADSLPEKFSIQAFPKKLDFFKNCDHGEETPVGFLEQLSPSGLLPILYKYGQTRDQLWHTELQGRCREISFHNLKLYVEMERLIQLSHKHEFSWLPWKGPSLAIHLYGDTALRQFNDLDFLVSDHELNRSLQLLLSDGYALLPPHDQHPYLLPLDQRCSFELFHVERQIRLDLTIKLIPLSGSRLQVREMLKRSQPSLEKRPYLQLSPEDLFLSLCIHGSKHAWERASWLMDIFLMILKFPRLDWVRIKKMARQHHQEKHLACGLIELSQIVPQGFLPEGLLSWANKKWDGEPKTLDSARDELYQLFYLHPKSAIFDILAYILLPHIQDWRHSQAKSLLNPRLWLSRPWRLLKAYG